MAALEADRIFMGEELRGEERRYLVAADAVIYRGAMVCIDGDGYLIPADDEDDITGVKGIALAPADNTDGEDGDIDCPVRRAENALMHTSDDGDAVVQADVGRLCYVLDDQTVVQAGGTTHEVVAGEVLGLEEYGGETMIRVKLGAAIHTTTTVEVEGNGD